MPGVVYRPLRAEYLFGTAAEDLLVQLGVDVQHADGAALHRDCQEVAAGIHVGGSDRQGALFKSRW